jgi:diaminopimelate epimerase
LPLFGAGVNVEFATVEQTPSGPRIEVAVHERGCGWTQACGTGATATAMEAARQGLVPFEQPVPVKLPGGWLAITVRPDFSAIMRGPATWVYDGQLDLATFAAQ